MMAGTAVPMIEQDGDVFDGSYSPRRLRFYLAHYESLRAIAESPESARAEMDGLRREWTLVTYWAERTARADVCYCADTNDGVSSPAERLGGPAAFGPPAHAAAVILADLQRATDALPIHWAATRALYELQGRADVWGARLAAHRQLGMRRPQDRLIEPFDSRRATIGLMARGLGWRPRREVA
jgi:hypothetical protein